MLQNLQKLLIEQKQVLRAEQPARGLSIARGLHEAQIAIFLVQLILMIGLSTILFIGGTTPKAYPFSGWFMAIGIPIAIFVAVFAELSLRQEPTFPNVLQYSILTGVTAAIPFNLGALVLLLEGVTIGAGILVGSSLVTIVIVHSRLDLLAFLIPQDQNTQEN